MNLKKFFTHEISIDFVNEKIIISGNGINLLYYDKVSNIKYLNKKTKIPKIKNPDFIFKSLCNITASEFAYIVKVNIGNIKKIFVRPRIFVAVPLEISDDEKDLIRSILEKLGARETFLIEKIIALMLGSSYLKLSLYKSDKIICIYSNNTNTYLSLFFSGGYFYPEIINEKPQNISVKLIENKLKLLLNNSREFPNELNNSLQNKKEILLKLKNAWEKDIIKTIVVICETGIITSKLNDKLMDFNLCKHYYYEYLGINGLDIFYPILKILLLDNNF